VGVLLLGKVFWQDWSVLKEAIFGGWVMAPKLIFGMIVGFPQATI
jgi:hypothetical protein